MYKERHAFNEKQFKLRMQQGHDVLPAYYQARKDEFKQYSLVQTERMINAVIDGVNISGFLDKMIFDGNRVTVVDYKTGKPENSAKKAAPPGPRSLGKLPNPYWFQLGIYQLMSNLQPGKSWQCNMALIDCIEKMRRGNFRSSSYTMMTIKINCSENGLPKPTINYKPWNL
jgi:ATP-dependent exoDNAse (exonuclease V) beta subunit